MMVGEHHFTMLLPGGSFCLRAKALGGGSPGAFPFWWACGLLQVPLQHQAELAHHPLAGE
jgi:hypothetical protein